MQQQSLNRFLLSQKTLTRREKKNVFDDDKTTKSVTIFHKLLKFDKLKNYKKLFEKKNINIKCVMRN